jgi:hypothetical protein
MHPLLVECSICHAKPGQPCTSVLFGKTLKDGSYVHFARTTFAHQVEEAQVQQLLEDLENWA